MKIVKIISECKRHRTWFELIHTKKGPKWKRNKYQSPKRGMKRVEAIIEENGIIKTAHLDIAG